MQFCEPITATVIYPFIFQLVNETGITKGKEDKTGYYAGIIVRSFPLQHFPALPRLTNKSVQESTFFLVETLFVLQWGRLSDRIGRKPVVLIGLLGLSLSMLCFGLSQTFPALVASRSLVGLLNGNVGVLKSMMGEITDDTNAAQGFAFIPIVWSTGSTIGCVNPLTNMGIRV
jgi:MFS family permease